MKTKATFTILVLLLLIVVSCSSDKPEEEFTPPAPVNYMILLDLSDRILQPGQAEYDIEMVFQVFEAFEANVRKNITINSKDRFCLMIADQQGTPYNHLKWENIFFTDMAKLDISIKNKKLTELRADLKKLLKDLYIEASYSTESSDYAGSDIWRFFHDRLPETIVPGYENFLLVLSDGYFDFESRSVTGQMRQMGTTTSFINDLRNAPDWKSRMEEKKLGICPSEREFPGLEVCVAGFRPKYRNLYENDILRYTWKQWLSEMQVSDVRMVSFGPLAGLTIW